MVKMIIQLQPTYLKELKFVGPYCSTTQGNFIWSNATQEIEPFSWCPKGGKL